MPVDEPLYPADLIPLQYHAVMLDDEARMSAFENAINLVVKPGMNVVDLGSGTGVLSFMAARAGARVTSVEKLPSIAATARELAIANGVGDQIQVVEQSATEFVPREPADVVICEMLHVGLLREKQVDVIRAFRKNHEDAFGPCETVFIPDTTFQAVQAIEQNFDYHGYLAPTPVFQQASLVHDRTTELSDPVVWQSFSYADNLPEKCSYDGIIETKADGNLNALRFITKSVLAVDMEKESTVDWFMQYMIIPVDRPLQVSAGDQVAVGFHYLPGDEVTTLTDSLSVG